VEDDLAKLLFYWTGGRSCALSIAWLMLTAGIDYNEAYVRVRKSRPICAPNTGFICSLLEWQRLREQPYFVTLPLSNGLARATVPQRPVAEALPSRG
ncbi:unnamed protein product, partial [Ascophyllum nodosum]